MTTNRYEAIDLARGAALLGVALVNVHAAARGWSSHYALDLASHWGDVVVEYIVALMFSHRSFPMLAFLFGAGIVMQWQRSVSADVGVDNARAISLRTLRSRYGALFVFGIVLGLLLWPGDIVSTYSLIALVALWRWPKSDARLRLWAIVASVLALSTYSLIAIALLTDSGSSSFPMSEASSFAQVSIVRALAMHPFEFLTSGLAQVALAEVWCAVLVGMWCAQTGRFTRWLNSERRVTPWFVFGFALLAIGTLLELYGSTQGGWRYFNGGAYGDLWMLVALPFTMIGSVFAWLALMKSWRTGLFPALRSLVSAAGKTPLTQFFGQSLVFAIVFNNSLIGWHGDMGRAAYSGVAVLTFVLWAGFARAWLAAGHPRGPVEGAWLAVAARFGKRRV